MKFAYSEGPWKAYMINGKLRVPLSYPTHVITPDGDHEEIPWNKDSLIEMLSSYLAVKPVSLKVGWEIELTDNPDVPGGGLLG